MHSQDPRPNPDAVHDAGSASVASDASLAKPGAIGARPRPPLWLLAAGAGLIAGLISWAGGEAAYDRFTISDAAVYPPNFDQIGGYEKMALRTKVFSDARVVVESRRTATAFGFLGFALGVALGLVGSLAAGSSHVRLITALGGGVLGATAGAVMSLGLVPLFLRYQDPESGIISLFLTQAAILGAIGATCGLVVGWARGDHSALVQPALGGLVGALLGTILYDTACSLAFPFLRTYEVIPTERVPRLMAHVSVAVCIALLAGLAAEKRARRPSASRKA
jgi:hypothetical protein